MANEFEKAIEKLEKIVVQLEKGDVPLEKSIALFEEGTKLSMLCGKLLDEAEQKVKLVSKDNAEEEFVIE